MLKFITCKTVHNYKAEVFFCPGLKSIELRIPKMFYIDKKFVMASNYKT